MVAGETRAEDAELERMLKEYQSASLFVSHVQKYTITLFSSKNRKKMIFMEKPLDLPYYKGI